MSHNLDEHSSVENIDEHNTAMLEIRTVLDIRLVIVTKQQCYADE